MIERKGKHHAGEEDQKPDLAHASVLQGKSARNEQTLLDTVTVLQCHKGKGIRQQEKNEGGHVQRGRVVETARQVAIQLGSATPAQGLAACRDIHDTVQAVARAAGHEAVGRVSRYCRFLVSCCHCSVSAVK